MDGYGTSDFALAQLAAHFYRENNPDFKIAVETALALLAEVKKQTTSVAGVKH
jgi:hypothetical protein